MAGSTIYQIGRTRRGGSRDEDEARELLGRARSSLALARTTGHGIQVDDLCLLAHQAVERSVRAVMAAEGIPEPADRSVRAMLAALEAAGVPVPDRLGRAANLFPEEPSGEPVRIEKYYEAVLVATEAIRFAAERVRG
jgi:HEPN domain-containing protein